MDSIYESIVSTIDQDYQSKKDMSLSSFTKKELSKSIIDKYKSDYRQLSHVRINKNTKGYVWLDGNSLVGFINVEDKDGDKWINSFEIFGKYKKHGLSKQMMNVAMRDLKATHLSVNKKNNVAIKIYKSIGFNTYKETDTILFMSINESYIEESKKDDDIFITIPDIDKDHIRTVIKTLSNDIDNFQDLLFIKVFDYNIAFDNGKPVGFILVRLKPLGNDKYAGSISIAVDPKQRRKGLAEFLTKNMIEDCRKEDRIEYLYWNALIKNTASINLAKKLKFKFEGNKKGEEGMYKKFIYPLKKQMNESYIEESSKYPEEVPDEIIDLLKRLNSYDYGYIKNGKKVKGMKNFFEDYKSLTISEFEKYQIGVCWDYVHYEAYWFAKNHYKYETFYIQVQDKDNDCPSHTYLVFYLANSSKVYYFESSWGKYQGIEEFDNINELHETIKDRHISSARSKCDPKTYFRNKYDAKSSSWEHLGCGEYMVKVSKGRIQLNESSSILPQNTGITTVIFDLGDVLVSANIKDYLVADPEVPNEIVDELFKLWFIDKDEVDDTMDLDTYREIVNKRMGVEFSKYIPKLFQYNVDCVNAFDYTIPIIQDLKDKGYKVYYLSNWPAWTHDLLQEAGKFDFLKLMDGGVFSYDVGYMKPDEEIYKILINKYKINPEEAVFFDDREENIEAANKLGIHGVHFPRHDSSIVYNNLYGRKLAKAICEELCEKYNVKLKEFDKSKFKDRAESLRKSVSILKQEISKYPILKKGKMFDYSKSIPKDFKNEYYEFINGQYDSISLYNINLWDIGMKVSPRSDEGQQYADENIFGPIKDEVMKKVSDRLPKGYSLDTGGDWDSLYITLVHKVSSNESLIEEEIENEFSPTSFVKRSSLPAKNQKNHARYLRKKAHSNKTNNATTQNELPKYNQIGELYVEEVAKSVQIKPIFIVTSYTNTPFGKAIKTFTHSEYTHAAISFDTSLEKLYSFNADSKYSNNGYKGGISRESLSSYVDSYEKTIIQVNCIFLKPSDFDIVQKTLDNLLENEEKTKYAYSNIINILIGRAKDTGMAMVCSQFVAYILHTANIELLDKPDNTVTPKDLSTITNPRVYKIFEGYAKDYEKKRIDRIFRKLKTKALLIKESLLKLCV